MKLKLFVASLSLLGLVSCPLFAAPSDVDTHKTSAHPDKHKTHHQVNKNVKHKHHHQEHARQEEMDCDCADMEPAPILDDPLEVCAISQPEMILVQMTQNVGRAMPNPCSPDWFNRIRISGGINIDLAKWGNRQADYQGENYKRFSLNDAYLNIAAGINEWTRAFLSLSFGDPTSTGFVNSNHFEYSSVYEPNRLNLEQAFATIGNFDVSPIFLQVGKQFQDFSRYERHPITRSMTQVLSETLRTSAKLGFIVPMGFNGSIFAFDDTIRKIGHRSFPTDYGAAIGIDQPNEHFGWDLGVAYMRNIISAKDIAHAVTNFTGIRAYNHRVGGIAAYADVNTGPFYLGARYTTAVTHFNRNDLPKRGKADLVDDNLVLSTAKGAKPWAVGVEAAYRFGAIFGWPCPLNQSIYVGYQMSHQAAGIGLPLSRYVVGYDVDIWKNTNFGLEWDRDHAYAQSHGGSHKRHTNLTSLRAAVQFG